MQMEGATPAELRSYYKVELKQKQNQIDRLKEGDAYEVGHDDGYAMGRDVERSYWFKKLKEFLDLEAKRSK